MDQGPQDLARETGDSGAGDPAEDVSGPGAVTDPGAEDVTGPGDPGMESSGNTGTKEKDGLGGPGDREDDGNEPGDNWIEMKMDLETRVRPWDSGSDRNTG